MTFLTKLWRRLRIYWPRTVELGGHRVALPAGHRLDWYRSRHRHFDEPIADICRLLGGKYGDIRAIDIGANVGDTAAMMVRERTTSVLCIEGNPVYLPLLKQNLARISASSEIEPSFIGFGAGSVSATVVTRAGTASLKMEESNEPSVELRSLADILADHPKFRDTHLFKVDTDGFDAKIVLGALPELQRMQSILYIEYSPTADKAVDVECRTMLQELVNIGYERFHVFDNFGNHMLCLSAGEIEHFASLNAYVVNTSRDDRPTLFYFDICAVAPKDLDISDRLSALYISKAGL